MHFFVMFYHCYYYQFHFYDFYFLTWFRIQTIMVKISSKCQVRHRKKRHYKDKWLYVNFMELADYNDGVAARCIMLEPR